jgi:hypothetical protein
VDSGVRVAEMRALVVSAPFVMVLKAGVPSEK